MEQDYKSSDCSSVDDNLSENNASLDHYGWIPEEESEPDYLKAGTKGDFALVKFSNKVFYIGKLMSDVDAKGDYEISYMRKTEKLGGCFKFPNVPDVHYVNNKDIEFVLPEPTNIMSKRLSSGFVKFPVSFRTYNVR